MCGESVRLNDVSAYGLAVYRIEQQLTQISKDVLSLCNCFFSDHVDLPNEVAEWISNAVLETDAVMDLCHSSPDLDDFFDVDVVVGLVKQDTRIVIARFVIFSLVAHWDESQVPWELDIAVDYIKRVL